MGSGNDANFDFDSPVPPSYETGSFDSFGSGGQGSPAPLDFNSFGSGNGDSPQPNSGNNSFDFGASPDPIPFESTEQPSGSFDAFSAPSDNVSNDFGDFEQQSGSFGESSTQFDEPTNTEEEEEEQTTTSSAFASMRSTIPTGASDVLREYENQHNMFLEEKAAEERKKHQQSIENGKAELDKFYAERKQKVSKTQEENRARQTASSLSQLINWEGQADTSTERLRNILMDMKHAA